MHDDEEGMDLFFQNCTNTRRLDIFVAHFRYIKYDISLNKLRQSKEYYLPMIGRRLASAAYALMLVDTSKFIPNVHQIYDFGGCLNRYDETLCIDILVIFKFKSVHLD